MNIITANRLVSLRKEYGLSQEELANQLGISRQAVSKWERAEASPDTDNLIALARLYRISLDELLRTELEAEEKKRAKAYPVSSASPFAPPHFPEAPAYPEPPCPSQSGAIPCPAQVEAERPPEPPAPPPYAPAQAPVEQAYPSSVHWNEEEKNSSWKNLFPVAVLLLYFFLGFVFHLWHPAWLLFLTVPLFYTLPHGRTGWMQFPYPVLVLILYLLLGFVFHLWHPSWLLFLTVPLYYGFATGMDRRN